MSSQFTPEYLQDLLKVTSLPPGVDCEILFQGREVRSVGWSEGQPDLQDFSSEVEFAVRVLKDGGQGLVKSNHLDQGHFEVLLNEALDVAHITPKDSHRKWAGPADKYPPQVATDPDLFLRDIDFALGELRHTEDIILKIDPRIKKVVKLRFSEEMESRVLVNSLGLALSKKLSSSLFMAEVLAEERGETEVAWDGREFRFGRDLKIEDISRDVATRVVRSLGGKPIASGTYCVVFHPRVGTQILSLLANALSAESVYLGRSFFKGKMGGEVASQKINVVDDPLLPGGLASASFDDEGTPHQKLSLIEKGGLKDFFYDLRSAKRDGCSSNGHGIRSGLSSPPSPHPTNFFIESGDKTPIDLLNATSQVFMVREVMGLHMADPVSGEFSLGASGDLYKQGEFVRPVRGVTIAGRLDTLLKNIAEVGNDLTWYGSVGSPSFLVPELTIAGT
jgi:PmbA protein